MKIRIGFVTNSSSSSFVIVNKTSKSKRLVDFVTENMKLIQKLVKDNDLESYITEGDDSTNPTPSLTLEEKIMEDTRMNDRIFQPGRPSIMNVSSEDDSLIDLILYHLSGDGKSKSFDWFMGD